MHGRWKAVSMLYGESAVQNGHSAGDAQETEELRAGWKL